MHAVLPLAFQKRLHQENGRQQHGFWPRQTSDQEHDAVDPCSQGPIRDGLIQKNEERGNGKISLGVKRGQPDLFARRGHKVERDGNSLPEGRLQRRR